MKTAFLQPTEVRGETLPILTNALDGGVGESRQNRRIGRLDPPAFAQRPRGFALLGSAHRRWLTRGIVGGETGDRAVATARQRDEIAMHNFWRWAACGAAMTLGAVGCKSTWNPFQARSKSAFDRDPLVMSHLTHSKDDPAYRDTDTDLGRYDEPQLQPASATQSRSNKPTAVGDATDYGAPLRSRAPDYAWLRGTVQYSRGEAGGPRESGWIVEYGRSSKDRYGGRLRLAPSPRLGLLREGDPVHLSGRIDARDPAHPVYDVADIILLR
jgi:hypothetical protein